MPAAAARLTQILRTSLGTLLVSRVDTQQPYDTAHEGSCLFTRAMTRYVTGSRTISTNVL